MSQNETVYQKKENLLKECEAYIKMNEEIDAIRVQQMIRDAFKHGYEEGITSISDKVKEVQLNLWRLPTCSLFLGMLHSSKIKGLGLDS